MPSCLTLSRGKSADPGKNLVIPPLSCAFTKDGPKTIIVGKSSFQRADDHDGDSISGHAGMSRRPETVKLKGSKPPVLSNLHFSMIVVHNKCHGMQLLKGEFRMPQLADGLQEKVTSIKLFPTGRDFSPINTLHAQ
jgi:hypothetical protein